MHSHALVCTADLTNAIYAERGEEYFATLYAHEVGDSVHGYGQAHDKVELASKLCPGGATLCAGRGVCDSVEGACDCDAGWGGAGCEEALCAGGCGAGTCGNGTCLCTSGFGCRVRAPS